MKQNIQFFMLVAMLFMASCDKGEETEINLAEVIAGEYLGYTSAEFVYVSSSMVTAGDNLVITANEDGTAQITYNSDTWGELVITSAVSLSGENYTLSGSGQILMGMTEGAETEYDCTLTGEISGEKEIVSVVIEVPSVMGGLTLTFYEGDVPEESTEE